MSERLVPLASLVTPFDIFRRWRVSRQDKEAVKINRQLQQVCSDWEPEQKQLLLRTAELIADAEEAKAAWKETGPTYQDLADLALDVGRVALQIHKRFPPPWEGHRRHVGLLVTQMQDFMLCGLTESSWVTLTEASDAARAALEELRRANPQHHGHVGRALIGKLAWLASSRQRDGRVERRNDLLFSYTIRNYERRIKPKRPAAGMWKKNWELVREVQQKIPDSRRRVFARSMRDLLK